MAFVNETLVSLSDFATKLDAFAVANGWTQDEFNAGTGRFALSNTAGDDDVYVSFRWDTGTPQTLAIYNALGWSVSTDPGNHTDDSGNGVISGSQASLGTGRGMFLDNIVQWWGFEDDHYIHFVVEIDASGPVYIHGGFGVIEKIGDWTGGAYAYGYRHISGVGTSVAVHEDTSVILDGVHNGTGDQVFAPTMHIEGLQNQLGGGSGKWAVVMGAQVSGQLGNDRAAVARSKIQGGFRGGPIPRAFGRFGNDTDKGLQPMYPILNWYVDTTTGDTHPLGWMKDTRGINMEFWEAGDVVNIGGDDWQVFPSRRKGSTGSLTNTSGHQGVAYKRVS